MKNKYLVRLLAGISIIMLWLYLTYAPSIALRYVEANAVYRLLVLFAAVPAWVALYFYRKGLPEKDALKQVGGLGYNGSPSSRKQNVLKYVLIIAAIGMAGNVLESLPVLLRGLHLVE